MRLQTTSSVEFFALVADVIQSGRRGKPEEPTRKVIVTRRRSA